MQVSGVTYSLGFFFGPGLPRGLGRPSDPTPEFRLRPDISPFRFFGGPSAGVGASVGGAGVELASDGLSLEELALIFDGSSSITTSGVDTGEASDLGSEDAGWSANLANISEGSLRMIIFFFFILGLSDRAVVGGSLVRVDVEVDMMMRDEP